MENKFEKFFDFCRDYKNQMGKSITQDIVDQYTSGDIFLGKLPTMVQGDEPLGAELIAKLEKYAEDNKLPSFKIVEDIDGNSVAEIIKK